MISTKINKSNKKEIIVITGGSEGLGREFAKVFTESKKYQVVIVSNDRKSLLETSSKLGADPFFCDVTDPVQVEKTVKSIFEKYKRIDCLINNAGIGLYGSLESYTPEEIRSVFETNTLGVIYFSRAIVPIMKKQKKGKILNMASTAAIKPEKNNTIYDASKSAVVAFTESLRQELAGNNISVMVLFPATIRDTGIFKKAGINKSMSESMNPHDVAKVVLFMFSFDELSMNQVVIRNVNHD